DRWVDRHFKNDLIWFVENFTNLPPIYKSDIRSELLKGPMLVESHFRIDHAGFTHLLSRPLDLVFKSIGEVCKSKKISKWTEAKTREELLRKKHVGADLCVKKIGKDFISFKDDYEENRKKPSIQKFK